MFATTTMNSISMKRLLPLGLVALFASVAQAAAPGIRGNPITGATTPSTFNLTAQPAYMTQPDGQTVYSWGYGCVSTSTPTFVPATITTGFCSTMQVPGPTLVVTEGQSVTVSLTNNLPTAAGNTSILFPGFTVTAINGVQGLLTQEAVPGSTVTYTFTAGSPGTRAYYSGTQGDLQVEMGLYGALIVLPTLPGGLPTSYARGAGLPNTCFTVTGKLPNGATDFRLAAAAYDHPSACYDREYLFQFSEMDPRIHNQAQGQVMADKQKALAQRCAVPTGCMVVETEPYHAAYFLINGRSMPDIADPNYAPQYPQQPYNGNPHMHPGELALVRIIGQGRMQHPFHEHANHVRLLARDGNLLLTPGNRLAGPLLFTTTTTPGQTMDGIFQFTGKSLNWDVYAHSATPGAGDKYTTDPLDPIYGAYNGTAVPVCHGDANGYYTTASEPPAPLTAPNYFEWCPDHQRPLESKPFGAVGQEGPVTLPDPNIVVNGAWYAGSPYLGADATGRAVGATPIPPSGTVANSPTGEAGFAYMWHSHNEREITTSNVFPGGMLMMMLVDPRFFVIDESN